MLYQWFSFVVTELQSNDNHTYEIRIVRNGIMRTLMYPKVSWLNWLNYETNQINEIKVEENVTMCLWPYAIWWLFCLSVWWGTFVVRTPNAVVFVCICRVVPSLPLALSPHYYNLSRGFFDQNRNQRVFFFQILNVNF